MKKIIFFTLYTLHLTLCSSVFALEIIFWQKKGRAGFPGEYLTTFTANAHAAALANTYTALSNDANGAYWNPAGLADIYFIETSFLYTRLFLHTDYGCLGFVYPLNEKNVFGVNLLTLQSAEVERTTFLIDSGTKFRDLENVFFISYARKISTAFNAGINLKTVHQEIADFSDYGVGMDIGLKYRPSKDRTFGLTLQNLLPPSLRLREEKERYPLNIKFGSAFAYFKQRIFWLCDFTVFDLWGKYKLSSFGDLHPLYWSTGIEYKPHRLLSLRAGFSYKELTAGFGLSTHNFDFDYGASFHRLGLTHRFSIAYRYGFLPSEEEKRVKKEKETWEKEKKLSEQGLLEEKKELEKEQKKFKKEQEIVLLFISARKYLDEKNYIKAREELQKIISLDAQNFEAKNLLVETDQAYRKESALNTFLKAEELYNKKLYQRCLNEVKKVLEYQPNFENGLILYHLSQGQVYIEERKYPLAKEEFLEVIKLNPEHKETLAILKRLQTVLEFYPFKVNPSGRTPSGQIFQGEPSAEGQK